MAMKARTGGELWGGSEPSGAAAAGGQKRLKHLQSRASMLHEAASCKRVESQSGCQHLRRRPSFLLSSPAALTLVWAAATAQNTMGPAAAQARAAAGQPRMVPARLRGPAADHATYA